MTAIRTATLFSLLIVADRCDGGAIPQLERPAKDYELAFYRPDGQRLAGNPPGFCWFFDRSMSYSAIR